MTLVTDYALGALCVVLAIRMRSRGLPQNRSDWMAALFACAVCGIRGWHLPRFSSMDRWHRCSGTVAPNAACNRLGRLCGSGRYMPSSLGRPSGTISWIARAQFGIYALAAIASGEFIVAIIDYSLAFVFVLAVHAWAWRKYSDGAALTVVGGVLVTFAAAGIQAAGIAPHRAFNTTTSTTWCKWRAQHSCIEGR